MSIVMMMGMFDNASDTDPPTHHIHIHTQARTDEHENRGDLELIIISMD